MANRARVIFNNNDIPNYSTYSIIYEKIGGSAVAMQTTFNTPSSHGSVFNAKIGATVEETAENYAIAFFNEFKNYGGTNNITVEVNGNVVDIYSADETYVFGSRSGTLDDTDVITSTEINAEPGEEREISFTIDASIGDECDNVVLALTVQGNDGLYEVELTGKGIIDNNISDSLTFHTLERDGVNRTLIVRDSSGVIGQSALTVPRKIDESEIIIDVNNTSLGAHITVNPSYLNPYVVPYEFSFNGDPYQTENIFSNLPEGNHTILVRDKFGCVTQKDFIITPYSNLSEIISLISEINPIRFFEINDNKKSYKNTISCKVNKDVANFFSHKYLEGDVISTQIKTNAPYIRVYTVDNDLNENDLFVEQVIQNTGQQGRTSARVFSANGKANLIYGDVKVYDSFGTTIESYQDYGPFLPTWIYEGAFINIESLASGVKVNRIYFHAGYNAFVAETNLNYAAAETEYIVLGVFNYNDYDVYEFLTTMAIESDSGFWVAIELGYSSGNITKKYLSEKIERVEDSDDLLLIEYSDDENRGQMVYQTGIKHIARYYGYSRYLGESEIEGYNGDDQFYKVDDGVYRTEEFQIPYITEEIAHKLRLITSHSKLFINNVGYKKYETAEIETNFSTNESTFTFKAKPNGNEFIPTENENFIDEDSGLTGAIESSQGKALILYTKNNG